MSQRSDVGTPTPPHAAVLTTLVLVAAIVFAVVVYIVALGSLAAH